MRANPRGPKPTQDCVFSYEVSEDFKTMTIGGVMDFQIAKLKDSDGLHYVVKERDHCWFEWKKSQGMSGDVIIDKPETFSGNSVNDATTFAYKDEFESKQCYLILDNGVWSKLQEWALQEEEEEEDEDDEDDEDDVMVTVKLLWPQGAPDSEVHEFEYDTTHEDNTDTSVVLFELDSDEIAGKYYIKGGRAGSRKWTSKRRVGYVWDAEQGKAVRKKPTAKGPK